mgnify:CR=1 FL=1
MDILGVCHLMCRLEHVDSFLTKRYPNGIESMVIEIPSNREELAPYTNPSFFEILSDRFEEKGTKVINGDISRPIPAWIKKAVDYCQSDKATLPEKLACYVGIAIPYNAYTKAYYGLYDGFISHKRDKHFEEVIREVNPQIVLVGDAHARVLRKKFKDATYVRVPI